MSATRAQTDFERELHNALKTGRVVLGTRRTLRLLKLGELRQLL